MNISGSSSVDSWKKFDSNTVRDRGNERVVDHKASALENLSQAGENILFALPSAFMPNEPVTVSSLTPFIGPIFANIVGRVTLPLVMLAMGIKNGLIDAPIHGAAALFSK